MAIDILDKLHESGELRELVHSGLISHNVIFWRKIYHAYHSQMEKGEKSTQAVSDVADVFGISDRMVYRILQRFK
jgi:hypothetical protein